MRKATEIEGTQLLTLLGSPELTRQEQKSPYAKVQPWGWQSGGTRTGRAGGAAQSSTAAAAAAARRRGGTSSPNERRGAIPSSYG